jgi:hypothetical protein
LARATECYFKSATIDEQSWGTTLRTAKASMSRKPFNPRVETRYHQSDMGRKTAIKNPKS